MNGVSGFNAWQGWKKLFSYLCQDGSFNPFSQGVTGVLSSEYKGTGVQLTAKLH